MNCVGVMYGESFTDFHFDTAATQFTPSPEIDFKIIVSLSTASTWEAKIISQSNTPRRWSTQRGPADGRMPSPNAIDTMSCRRGSPVKRHLLVASAFAAITMIDGTFKLERSC
jgi:hypothetical protein